MDTIAAALAGLLHDIGKFWQRAESAPGRPLPRGYETFTKEDFGSNGTHAAWSAALAKQVLSPEFQDVASAVFLHHKPDALPEAAQLALADYLAAGERADTPVEQPKQTTSVLAELKWNAGQAYWPLEPLELREAAFFPGPQPLTEAQSKAAYQALWAAFIDETSRLHAISDGDTLLSELLGLLERYTWGVPAAFYRSRPDISLYDHSRVTAALAACISELSDAEITAHLQAARAHNFRAEPVAVLVRGDISGVQKFIYTITARGATQSLRGRSFFLQLLTEAIARWLLRRLNLPITNLIYAGGGHFDLLVAASQEAHILELQAELDSILLRQFDGDLYVALGAAPLSARTLQREEFFKGQQMAGRAAQAVKRQRFAEGADRLFGARGFGGGSEVECQVCHFEGSDVKAIQTPSGQSVYKCSLCRSLEELGKDLRGAELLVLAEVPESETDERSWSAVLRRFGLAVSIRREGGEWSTRIPDAVRGDLLGLRTYPTAEDVTGASAGIHSAAPLARRQRFVVNVAPRLPNHERATFEDLQNASAGLKRLGVLRMDVDNLGNLFSTGFEISENGKPVNAATLARVAGLSSALTRFFEGWVGVLAARQNAEANEQKKTEPIYTIYSGGDDLFIVGAWDAVVQLAVRIRDDFARYVSGNAEVHLSAGISLHGGKEPLYQAAQAAGEALDEAKSLDGKNAISFLGESLKWDDFIRLEADRDRLLQFLEQRVDRSVLRVLMDLEVQRADTVKRLKLRTRTKAGDPQLAWGPYMWRGAYLLRRFADRTNGPAREAFHTYIDELRRDDFRHIRTAALAARWVDALTRKEKKS